MRRSGGRPNARSYNAQPPPLMGNQYNNSSLGLPGLQDIDLELELLKRKREIIEQQQQMLNDNNSILGNRFGEFSHMYEDRGGYGGGAGSSGGKKRPQVWEHELSPKRFAGNNSAPERSYSQFRAPKSNSNSRGGFQPRSSGYQPRSSGFQSRSGYKPAPNPSVPKKKDFKPTKVTKPSSAPAPNKLNTYSQPERRHLVKEAVNSGEILRDDRPITDQQRGRLELALGNIMKEIRLRNPKFEEHFKDGAGGRAIKQALRHRLYACMMGKPVTVYQDTINIYRQHFPPETDKDLLLNCVELAIGSEFVPFETDNPQEYFVMNISRLMMKKMEEMFKKLSEMYSSADKLAQKRYQKKGNPAKNKTNPDGNAVDEKPKDDDVVEESDQKPATEVLETEETKPEPKVEPKQEETELDEKAKKIVSTEEYKKLDSLMTGMIPHLLKKMAPVILKAMKTEGMYRKTFHGIKQDLRRKLIIDENFLLPKKQPNCPPPGDKTEVSNVGEPQKPQGEQLDKKFLDPLPYYVKILGRPTLPRRKGMQDFFDRFKPQSIKKHRTIHHILFVGFADKQAFENILAASGTVIGKNTLTIKVSERLKQTPGPNASIESIIINEDLDEQITELLSSIKKSEGLLDDGDVEMTSDETKQEVNDENETKPDIDGSNVEITAETDLGVPENGVTENLGQENDKEPLDVKIEESENVAEAKTEGDTDKDAGNIAAENNTENGTNDNNKNDTQNVENTETADKAQENEEIVENMTEIESEKKDTVTALISDVKETKGTPTRSSARLAATPGGGGGGGIRTRRASRLDENHS